MQKKVIVEHRDYQGGTVWRKTIELGTDEEVEFTQRGPWFTAHWSEGSITVHLNPGHSIFTEKELVE